MIQPILAKTLQMIKPSNGQGLERLSDVEEEVTDETSAQKGSVNTAECDAKSDDDSNDAGVQSNLATPKQKRSSDTTLIKTPLTPKAKKMIENYKFGSITLDDIVRTQEDNAQFKKELSIIIDFFRSNNLQFEYEETTHKKMTTI